MIRLRPHSGRPGSGDNAVDYLSGSARLSIAETDNSLPVSQHKVKQGIKHAHSRSGIVNQDEAAVNAISIMYEKAGKRIQNQRYMWRPNDAPPA